VTLTEHAGDLTPVEPPPSRSRSRRRSIAVLVVLVAAIVALLSQGLLHNLNYFDTVNQAMAQRPTLGTTTFRLEGVVARGTITRTSSGASFYLNGRRTDEVFVIAHGEPPELFQADIPVVVDGHFTSSTSRTFVATSIIVKHSANYVAQHPGRVRAPNGSVR
jgi:cytochrome c-type biogenesis protein CcmE